MTIYAVVDYENDFVDGALGFPGAEELDGGIVERGRQVQEDGGLILEIHDTHGKDYLNTREGRALPIVHTVPGTPGWEIYGKTRTWLDSFRHPVLCKPGFGLPPEVCLELPDDVDRIELVGLVTNMCVIAVGVTLQARYPEAQVVVHKNLVASFDGKRHLEALSVMAGMQMEIDDKTGAWVHEKK